jgi:hypothetical protein
MPLSSAFDGTSKVRKIEVDNVNKAYGNGTMGNFMAAKVNSQGKEIKEEE